MSSLYLYAIARPDASLPDDVRGIKNASVERITEHDVSMLTSSIPDGRLRPRRRNLKAHHDVIKQIAATDTLLPMAFGVVAHSAADVRSFLADHAARLGEQLDHVNGHVEIGLRLVWNVDDIFAHFVKRYDQLRELRDTFFGEDGSANRQQMIRLGERFESLLNAERDAHRATLEDHLSDVCRSVVVDEPRKETDAAVLSCLVPRDGVDAFEAAVQEMAGAFDDTFTFTYTDPLAPYTFADVNFG